MRNLLDERWNVFKNQKKCTCCQLQLLTLNDCNDIDDWEPSWTQKSWVFQTNTTATTTFVSANSDIIRLVTTFKPPMDWIISHVESPQRLTETPFRKSFRYILLQQSLEFVRLCLTPKSLQQIRLSFNMTRCDVAQHANRKVLHVLPFDWSDIFCPASHWPKLVRLCELGECVQVCISW